MPTSSPPQNEGNERIDLRGIPKEEKNLLRRAASYSRMSLSRFLISSAHDRAKKIVAEHETLTLSAEDWDAFLIALDNTDKPRPNLEAAASRYLDIQKKTDDDTK